MFKNDRIYFRPTKTWFFNRPVIRSVESVEYICSTSNLPNQSKMISVLQYNVIRQIFDV